MAREEEGWRGKRKGGEGGVREWKRSGEERREGEEKIWEGGEQEREQFGYSFMKQSMLFLRMKKLFILYA